VDLTAPAGRGGSWLLDPATLTVIAAAGTCGSLPCGAGSQTVQSTVVETALGSGDVTLDATVSITVDASIAWNATNALTLAAPTVTINAPIAGTGNANTDLIFSANVRTLNLAAPISADGGIVTNNAITIVNVSTGVIFQGSIQTAIDIVNAGGTVNV